MDLTTTARRKGDDLLPLFFFAAAGASVAGGIGSGWYLWKRGQQEVARRLLEEDAQNVDEAIRREIDRAKLREEARAAGVDPEEVERG